MTVAADTRDAYDIVVVGGGVAGSVAARRAQQLGARVVLLDKPLSGPGGNTRMSTGWFHAAYLDPKRPPAELYAAIMKSTDGHARPDVARAWSENVARAFEFLRSEGATFAKGGAPSFPEYRGNEIQPQPSMRREDRRRPDEWKPRGPNLLLTRMQETFVAQGGSLRKGTRAVGLETEGGAVVGVRVTGPDGAPGRIRGRAVIMAEGGFQANRELVARYITTDYYIICSHEDTGDGLQMGMAVGARTYNMDAFYGHLKVRDLERDDARMAIYGSPILLTDAAIVVNGRGERIGDEFRGSEWYTAIDDPITNTIAKCDTPGDCWVVFDSAVWETVGRVGAEPLNPGLQQDGGPLFSAPSVEELARAMKVPAEKLVRTVAGFNRFVKDGAPIDPPRRGAPGPIDQAPYCAIPLIAGITFVMGGLLVNGNGQVLDENDRPIPGLYAAGQSMAGLQGGPRNGYTGGWSEATTFGVLSGEHAAASVKAGAKALSAS